MKDMYKSDGNEYRENNLNGMDAELEQIKGKSNVLQRTIEGTQSQVTDLQVSQSTIEQTMENITLRVESIEDELDGAIEYYEGNDTPTLLNYPAWDFTYNIPCNNTVKTTNDLKFIYSEEYYNYNIRDMYWDLDDGISYRFGRSNGQYGWIEIQDTEFNVIMARVSDLELTVEGITGTVEQITGDISSVRSDISTLTQRAGSIEASVTSEISARQNADDAKLNHTHNSTSFGWQLTSTKFSLKSNNSEVFVCSSSGIKVNGEINATSGVIGGCSIINGQLQVASANITSIDGKSFESNEGQSASGGYNYVGKTKINGATVSVIENAVGMFDTYKSVSLTHGGIDLSSYDSFSRARDEISIRENGITLSRSYDGTSPTLTTVASTGIITDRLEISKDASTTTLTGMKNSSGHMVLYSGSNDVIQIYGNGANRARIGTSATQLGFFGAAGQTYTEVSQLSSSTTSVATVRDKVREIISALHSYGII